MRSEKENRPVSYKRNEGPCGERPGPRYPMVGTFKDFRRTRKLPWVSCLELGGKRERPKLELRRNFLTWRAVR